MRKMTNFTPPKPIPNPFGEGSGQAHSFSLGRDGVSAIVETKEGNIIIVQDKPGGAKRAGFLHLSGGGYGRLADDEVERLVPKEPVK